MTDLHKYSGDVYLSHLNADGSPRGYFGPIECDAFVPGRSTEESEDTRSKKRDTYDQIIDSEPGAVTPSLRMVFKEVPTELLALAFASSPSAITVAGSTVVEAETVISRVGVYQLPHRNLATSPAPVITEDADTDPVVYAAGDDYVIDHRIGLIRIVPGGAIATALAAAQDLDPDATLTLRRSYTYTSFSATEFVGETVRRADLAVLFDGQNRKSGKDLTTEYWHVQVPAPDDIFDLLSSELISLELEGTPITPPGKTGPFRVLKVA